jgi:LuxR family maltose regulon positive regulatory protein
VSGRQETVVSTRRGGAAATSPGSLLLATKLHPPSARREVVARPRLVRLLATPCKLTLVDAPAGWGKTTLLGEWCGSPDETRPFAWLSLDAGDNDPARFGAYLVEAISRALPELDAAALSSLRAPGTTLSEVLLPALINELALLPNAVVLVLDDYHAITNPEVHESVAFLLEHMPPTLQLVLATRSDPPLPLARLRARGELTEIRARELRFSEEEAETLLVDVLGLRVDARDVGRLHERTEGWAAGLYLAALSLHGRENVHQLIEAFAGDDRHIVDYLGIEVLGNQPDEVRTFLLRTSILDRLSGPLCDAVTGESGSAGMLERIERSNLFLVPLDTTRQWYRYHRLFAGLLRHELSQREPDLVPELHRRAAAWHGAHDAIPEAIHHLLAASELEAAAELIARHWNAFFNQGRLATVASWLDALPESTVRRDARLCVARAWILMDLGRLDDVERWIASAERDLGRDDSTEYATAILRLVYRFKSGDIDAANAAARAALELAPVEPQFEPTVANCLLGVTLLWRGEPERSVGPLTEAARLAELSGNALGAIYALGYLALAHAELGDLGAAEPFAASAGALADDPARAEHFVSMLAHLGRGAVLLRREEFADADRALARAVELSHRGAGLVEIAYALLAHAEARAALGDSETAGNLLRRARTTLEQCPDPGIVGKRTATALRRPPRPALPARPGEELTDRELAVLRLLPAELSQREIGQALYVSLNTVKTHTKGIFRKLGVTTRADAVRRGRELGLL